MNGIDTFLDINNAHLRVNNGNVQASTFVLDQINIVTSANTATTVGFNNATTAFLAASNIEVGTANLFVDTTTSKVGIGTDAPAYTLDVHGSANVGALTATTFSGSGAGLNSIPSSAISGTLSQWIDINTNDIHYSAGNVGIGKTPDSGKKLDVDGTVKATTFEGEGSALTALNATNIASGTLDVARVPDLDAAKITTGTLDAARVPDLDAAKITTGTLDAARVPVPTTFTAATFSGDVTVDTTTFHVDTTNDRVGIGTTSPATKLHLYDTTNEPTIALQHLSGTENNSSTNILGNLALHYSARSGGYPSVGIRSIRRASTWDDQADMEFYVRNGGNGEQTAMVINSASTNDGAKVGIGTSTPIGKLDIYQGTNVVLGGTTQTLSDPAPGLTLTSSSAKWAFVINSNDDLVLTSHDSLSGTYTGVTGYILEGAYDQRMNDFTGQHRCFLPGVKASEIVNKTGLIVSANKNQYTMISHKTVTGQEAIDISESIPNVSISLRAYDKTCFGVISDVEDPEKREDVYGVWGCPFPKENGDDRVYINSVGEGAIWVTNINGPLESGDYITTSNVAGYGQKQDSEFLANYTVAKITMDCDFDPATQPVQVIKKGEDGENVLEEHGQIQWEDHATETEKAYKIRYLDASGVETDEASAVHKAAFVGCTYHCG